MSPRPDRVVPPASTGLVRQPEGLHVAEAPGVPQEAAALPAPVPAATSGLVKARELVARATRSARTSPGEWESFAIRVPAQLKARLDARWVADRNRMEAWDLAQGHYVEAALCELPGDVDTAAAWGMAYADAHPDHGQPVPAGPRMRAVTARRMRELRGQLQVMRYRRVTAWEVQAAALERLLDRLDAEDGAP